MRNRLSRQKEKRKLLKQYFKIAQHKKSKEGKIDNYIIYKIQGLPKNRSPLQKWLTWFIMIICNNRPANLLETISICVITKYFLLNKTESQHVSPIVTLVHVYTGNPYFTLPSP